MGSAKDIELRPIPRKEADALIKRVHYSGKVTNNCQLHIGVFYDGRLEGAMQFGPSLDKRKIMGLVADTGWNEFIELNRMAFTEALPRNSESRALSVAMRLIKKYAPQIKWVISFADGTQCGDGTIYRASGFVLTSIKKNDQIWELPGGEVATSRVATNNNPGSGREALLAKAEQGARFSRTSMTDNRSKREQARVLSRGNATKGNNITHAMAMRGVDTPGASEPFGSANGAASMRPFIELGARPLEGFQLRYIYFIDPAYRAKLTVPELPYSAIADAGAGMYRGERITRVADGSG